MLDKPSLKNFSIHLLIAFALGVAFVLSFFYLYLPSTTNHGENVLVPDLKGNQLSVAQKLLEDKNLTVFVYDSTYMDGQLPGTILNQTPAAGTEVKEGRAIYVTIVTSITPQVKMPQLISSSVKQAEMVLKSYGLKLGVISFQPNVNENAVLKQMINKLVINPGQMVAKGSIVDLVVGTGLSDSLILVPNLIGLTQKEAETTLQNLGLESGSIVYDENNEDIGLVFKQKPDFIDNDSTQKIRVGSIVDIWVGGKKIN